MTMEASNRLDVTNIRLRGRNGKFVRDKPPSSPLLRKLNRRKEREVINASVGDRLFDGLLDVLFLEGYKDDWIPGDAKLGPLAIIPERLFKGSYLPNQSERLQRSINRFFLYEAGRKQTNLAWKTVRDGSDPG